MLERIDNGEETVDVFNYLQYLRTRRLNMVQTLVSCFPVSLVTLRLDLTDFDMLDSVLRPQIHMERCLTAELVSFHISQVAYFTRS